MGSTGAFMSIHAWLSSGAAQSTKRALDDTSDLGSALKAPKTVSAATPATAPRVETSIPFSTMFAMAGGFGFGGFGGRAARGHKSAVTRELNSAAAAEWAAAAAERPFKLADLALPEKCQEAATYFSNLSLADLKSECAMHQLPVTGSKTKLLEALRKKSVQVVLGNPKRGQFVNGDAPGHKLGANDAGKVRKALVADLRKCLVFDKKLKKGSNKMMKAQYSNCSLELFATLFPHANGKKKCAVEPVQLQIDAIAKNLRYGGQMGLVAGSLNAKIDAEGNISLCGKYGLGMW